MGQENRKKARGISIVFVIVAVILGNALRKQFDFQTFRFDKPALAALYAVVLGTSIYLVIRGYTSRPEN